MFGTSIVRQFEAIGARARVNVTGLRFEIDLTADRYGDLYELRIPLDGSAIVRVPDVERHERQLLLAASSPVHGWSQKFLCGHDEFHWFVAALPRKPEADNVHEAFEALKPRQVLLEQERKRVRRRKKQRRRTTAYLRQGEWFFVPRPNLAVTPRNVRHNEVLVRDGGTPHMVEWLYRPPGQNALFARGLISHPDHRALHLENWYQVFRNMEVTPVEQPLAHRMWLQTQPWKVGFVD
jgi:hypothetical protein